MPIRRVHCTWYVNKFSLSAQNKMYRDTVWRIWIPMLGYKGSTTFAPLPTHPFLSHLQCSCPPVSIHTWDSKFFLRYQISSTFLDQTTATGTVFPYLKTLLSFCNKCCIHVAKYLFRGHWKINTWDLRRKESSGTVKYSTCNYKIKKLVIWMILTPIKNNYKKNSV